jgi:DNA-binding NarL/FixJ family response regulator
MNRQYVAATGNIHGMFTAVNRPSRAAISAGITRENILGKTIWDFGDDVLEQEIRDNFARCLMDGSEVHYKTSSHIQGVTEHWDCRIMPAPETAVLIVAEEFFDDTPDMTAEDVQIISYLDQDLTVHQIGLAMHICDTTAASKLYRLRTKCGVQTNHGLLSWAARRGVI